jgi:hypothetical protein
LKFPRCDGESDAKIVLPSGCTAVAGVRGSVVGTTGGNGARGAGLQFALDSEEHTRLDLVSELARYRLAIGGGGAGFEGTLQGLWAIGLRVPVTKRQGPIVRAGLQGYILGNDAFYASLLELPQIQGGWQWASGATVFEAAATSGVAITGRFRTAGSDSRELSGFTYGGHVSVHVPWGRLSVVGERISSGDALGGPVDTATGIACFTVSPVALCGDARAAQADAVVASAVTHVRMFYAGLTIGVTADH